MMIARDRRIPIIGQIVAKKLCAGVKIVAMQSTTGCHDLDSGAEFFWPQCGVLSTLYKSPRLHSTLTLTMTFTLSYDLDFDV